MHDFLILQTVVLNIGVVYLETDEGCRWETRERETPEGIEG